MADYSVSDLRAAIINQCPHCTQAQIGRAMAISLAENPARKLKATNTNNDPQRTVDRGPWQINSYWHREVPDSCAFDLACSTHAAYRISGGFHSFSQWSTNKGITQADIDSALAQAKGGDNTSGSGILGTGVGPDVATGASEAIPKTGAALAAIANSLEHLVSSLFSSSLWFRVGKVLVGLFLGGAGLIILIRKAGVSVPAVPIPV